MDSDPSEEKKIQAQSGQPVLILSYTCMHTYPSSPLEASLVQSSKFKEGSLSSLSCVDGWEEKRQCELKQGIIISPYCHLRKFGSGV